MNDNINIAFSFDCKYVNVLKVALASLLYYRRSFVHYNIYLLCDELTKPFHEQIIKLCQSYDEHSHVEFKTMGDKFKGSFEIRNITTPTYYRLLLHKILPDIDTIIYSDIDVLFQGDLLELTQLDLGKNALMGEKASLNLPQNWHELELKEPEWAQTMHACKGNYIQAGFLVMNLKEIRKMNLTDEFFIKESLKKYLFQDQDILNKTYEGKKGFLPPKFNRIAYFNDSTPFIEHGVWTASEAKEAFENPIMIHYAGEKPWNNEDIKLDNLWWDFVKSQKPLKGLFKRKIKWFQKVKKENGRRQIYFCGIKIFSYKKNALLINKKLKHCKYVHWVHTEKFTNPTVQFFNQNFNMEEHLFLCAKAVPTFDIPNAPNVVSLSGVDLNKLNLKRKNIQKIFFHSLCVPRFIDWLYEHQDISCQKCYWIIWGGDLYGTYGNSESVLGSEKDILVRRNFKGYISAFDKKKACEILNLDVSKFFTAFVPCPITKEMLETTHKEKHNYIQIQVNHSCNKTTLEMLEILAKWKDKNIRVSTVLSYDENESCAEEIKQKGREIFGDKFSYLDKMLSAQEYAQFLAQNDILILNHNRQQGMGNAIAALNLGVKMFIKSDVSTYHFFNDEERIKVFDAYKIKDMSFEEFTSYTEKDNNLKKAARYYDNDYLVSLWRNIFKGDLE